MATLLVVLLTPSLVYVPETRKKQGFGGEQLAEMQKIIDAEKSDLFDVLAH